MSRPTPWTSKPRLGFFQETSLEITHWKTNFITRTLISSIFPRAGSESTRAAKLWKELSTDHPCGWASYGVAEKNKLWWMIPLAWKCSLSVLRCCQREERLCRGKTSHLICKWEERCRGQLLRPVPALRRKPQTKENSSCGHLPALWNPGAVPAKLHSVTTFHYHTWRPSETVH